MSKKGFTLIELMGVITILAVISLLVAPVIINQIRNSKEKMDDVTEQLIYSAAELYLDNKENDYPKNEGSTYCLTLRDLVNDGKLTSPVVNSNGDEISYDKIIAIDVVNANYSYRLPSSCENITTRKEYTFSDLLMKPYECMEKGEICTPGEQIFAIKVNDNEIQNFYVLSDDGNKVTLIMDRSFSVTSRWYAQDDNSIGPLTALERINQLTSGWENISVISDYTYINNLNGTTNAYGYRSYHVTNGAATLVSKDGNTISSVSGITRARLLTYEEVLPYSEETSPETIVWSIPQWLYGYLDGVAGGYAGGYWLLTSSPTTYAGARFMGWNGRLHLSAPGDNVSSMRVVIELLK